MVTVANRIRINLAVVSLAFLLNLSAYLCLEGLQSSLNPGMGTGSLSVAYATGLVMSLFLPALAMNFLTKRKAMAISTLSYTAYTLANFYPRPYTLLPAAVILGCGGVVWWTSGRVYVSDLARAYGTEMKVDVEQTTSHFFGIFTAASMASLLVGNGISSLVLQSTRNLPAVDVTTPCGSYSCTNLPSTQSRYTTDRPNPEKAAYATCGVHNCDISYDNQLKNTTDASFGSPDVDKLVINILFGAFAASQVVAAMLILFVLSDEKTNEDTDHKVSKDNDDEKVPMAQIKPEDESSLPDKADNKPVSTSQRIKQQMIATGKFLLLNHRVKALFPIACHAGILQVFAYGQFTKHWIACYMGITFIGYGISIYGIGAIIGSYGYGFLAKFTPRWTISILILTIEISLGTFLLLWEPATEQEFWAFFLAFGVHGIVFSSQKAMLPSVFSVFFTTERGPAIASLLLCETLGSAVAYSISAQVCNKAYIIAMLSMGGVGTILYLFMERSHTKKRGIETPVVVE